MDNPGVKFPPPFVYILFFVIGWLLNKWYPLNIFPARPFQIIGLLFLILWVFLTILSFKEFRKEKTSFVPVKPATKLLSGGIFKYTRNPMYLSLVSAYIGLSFLLKVFWPLIFLPFVFIIMNKAIIEKEEAYLERKFGENYLQYKSRVHRWF